MTLRATVAAFFFSAAVCLGGTVAKENFVCLYQNNIALFVELERSEGAKPLNGKLDYSKTPPEEAAAIICYKTSKTKEDRIVAAVKGLREQYLNTVKDADKNQATLRLDMALAKLGVLRAIQMTE